MAQWSVQQWASLISILVVAVSAIAVCTRISLTVKILEKKLEDLERECETHRNNSDIHRNKDYRDWIDSRFTTIEKKLDQILTEQKRSNA